MLAIDNLGRLLLILGLAIAIVGVVVMLIGRLPFAGRLPGDIVIQRDNVSCFFPLATMIVISLIITLVVNLVAWLLRR